MFRRITLTCVLGLAACGPRARTAPADDGLQSYLQALRSDDPKPLYEMLTSEQRAAISYEAWVAQWRGSAAERAQQADLVESRWEGQATARASVKYQDGQSIRLRESDAGWRLEQALVSTSTTPTPGEGLAQLLAALERQNLPALMALMSTERRTSIEERVHAFLEGLAEQSGDGHTNFHRISDTRHELVWNHEDVRYRLVFVLEGVNWRLNELHMGPDPAAVPEEEAAKTEPIVDGAIRRRR
ncbi:MAG: hypothetical protein GY811_14885 [Myxococcales bacterium]|nr:hypothetical protein [Myxococcales bacterium]